MFWCDDDYGINRDGWSEKSKAALRREEDAIKKFDLERAKMEARVLEPGSCNMVQLLNPKEHLTGACLKTFRQHVNKFKGWNVKRQVVSEDLKPKLKITRKSKVYYTNVYYTAPVNLDELKENLVPQQPFERKYHLPSSPPVLMPSPAIMPGSPVYSYHQPIPSLPSVAFRTGNFATFSGFQNYRPLPSGTLSTCGNIPGPSHYQYSAEQLYGNYEKIGLQKRTLNDLQDHGGKKSKC